MGSRSYFVAALWVLLGSSVHAQSLQQALASAQARDPALQSALAGRDAAEENIRISRGRLLPQISFQDSRQSINQTTTQDTVLGPQAREFTGQSYNRQLSLRQGLIRGRDWEGYSQSQYQAEYGEQKYLSAKADLWSRVTSSWLDLIAARQLKAVYESTLQSVTESAKQEAKRYERGDGTRDAKAEAQAQQAQAQAMYTDAKLNLEARVRAYELLTGAVAAQVKAQRLPEEVLGPFAEADRAALWALIEAQAPELQIAILTEKVNLSRADQAKYDHLPTLDFVASATHAQNDATNTLGYRYNNRQAGVVLQVPIFSGGAVEGARKQAYSVYLGSVADRQSLMERMETQFTTDWAAQAGLRERAGAARELITAAMEQRRAIDLGLKGGLRTWSDLGGADLLMARRYTDWVNLQLSMLKTQARILSLAPVAIPQWEKFVLSLDAAVPVQ